jgi:hypothetical protein
MSDHGWLILGTVVTFDGAMISLFAFLFQSPRLSVTARNVLKFMIFSLFVSAAVFMTVLWFAPEGKSSVVTDTTTGPRPPVSTQAADQAIQFLDPREGGRLEHHLNVTLSGTVPAGQHLWILVYSLGDYYVQGTPEPSSSNEWFLAGVTLGTDTDSNSVGAPYILYAVLADDQAEAALGQALNETHGETGFPQIPGGTGAIPVAKITVVRTT